MLFFISGDDKVSIATNSLILFLDSLDLTKYYLPKAYTESKIFSGSVNPKTEYFKKELVAQYIKK